MSHIIRKRSVDPVPRGRVVVYLGDRDAIRWGYMRLGVGKRFAYHWDRLTRRVRLWRPGIGRMGQVSASIDELEVHESRLLARARRVLLRYETAQGIEMREAA
jgi:hypothetical protein